MVQYIYFTFHSLYLFSLYQIVSARHLNYFQKHNLKINWSKQEEEGVYMNTNLKLFVILIIIIIINYIYFLWDNDNTEVLALLQL